MQESGSESLGTDQSDDVSSGNQFNLTNIPAKIDASSGITTAAIQRLPEILVYGSDMDEIVEDGKINQLMDYIERIAGEEENVDKLQFKEYLEQPKRQRYSSRNYETDKDNEDELSDFSMLENDVDEMKDLANENKSSNFNSKRAINNRKPNMFALATPSNATDGPNIYRPVIRITPTEDERVEQFLHENGHEIQASNYATAETLRKSKTTQSFDCSDGNASDAESFESDSRANSPTIDAERRESQLSVGSDTIQFECKRPSNPNYFYNREDSSSSNKSNVLFERCDSRYSELEYIKGRDDWKDSYERYDISEEIDSDNYHHLRRHSEAADTLEYIRGRDDWARNALTTSLPKIFEVGEPKTVIQNEIDSDEYHHNFSHDEAFRSTSESIVRETRSFESDSRIADSQDRMVTATNDHFASLPKDIDMASDATTGAPANVIFDRNNGINEVIEDLISHEATHNDDIEITVLDLTIDGERKQQQTTAQPMILISEAAEDNRQLKSFSREQIESGTTCIELNTNNGLVKEVTESAKNKLNSSRSADFLHSERTAQTENRSQPKGKMQLEQEYETSQSNNRNVRAKSERYDESFLKPNEQKPRRTLSFENVEDLIQEVSLGPWFHK